jgi:hypothetical protein
MTILHRLFQTIVAGTSQDVYPYLPTYDAFRQIIKRVWHIDYPTEPQSLINLSIPENMRKTLNGSDFLARDLTIGEERVLIFSSQLLPMLTI